MSKETKKLLQAIKDIAKYPKGTAYNSNNSWGFGGIAGKVWNFKSGHEMVIGRACTRHAGTHKVEIFRKDGINIFDESKFTEGQLREIINLVK